MKLKFGIPCSQLKDKIKDVEIQVTSEIEAMGLAAGCILAGEKCEVYMQNSGLLAIGDVVCSLYHPYEIPLPKLLLSIRHSPFHHSIAGKITRSFLDLINYDGEIEIVEQEVV